MLNNKYDVKSNILSSHGGLPSASSEHGRFFLCFNIVYDM